MKAPEPAVFEAPWQAQAFALVVKLNEAGAFTWSEWAEVFARELGRGQDTEYWNAWLAALEQLVTSRGLAPAASLADRKTAWAEAYRRTPHGRPVEL